MEVREGYKQTEVGVIPEDWNLTKFSDFAETEGGYAFCSKKFQVSGKYQVVKMSNIYGGVLNLLRSQSFIDEVSINEKHYVLNPNDIIITLTGTVGKTDYGYSWRIDTEKNLLLNQRVARIIVEDFVNSKFVGYYCKTPMLLKQFFERAKGGTGNQTNVGTNDIKEIMISLPKTLEEQTAIANTLSDTDELIQSLETLITKKYSIKLGAMQELLKPKEGWVVKTFGDLFTISGGYSASRDQLSREGPGYCYLHYGDIHGSKKNFVDVANEYMEIPKLNIQLNKISRTSLLNEGDIVFVDASEDDEGTSRHIVIRNPYGIPFISGLHTIVAKSIDLTINNEFKRYCFQSAYIKSQFKFYAVGTKVTGISKSNIAKIEIFVPSVEEQTRIATILSDMDAEITALVVKLDKYKQIKQGMMQTLLTGRIRLI